MFAHLDADAFFASVLQRRHPRLKGKPLLALGMGGGCVIAASYEAKAKGVKTGMRLKDAKKLAPAALAMPADFKDTCMASKQIASVIRDHCSIVEKTSPDEWFLDLGSCVGGVPSNLSTWAVDLQTEIDHRTQLPVSIGIAPSKLLAKMASDYRKPRGVFVVIEEFAPFLGSLPVAAIPGIGRRRQVHAHAQGWHTAWDFSQAPEEMVRRLFGRPGLSLQTELRGIPTCQVARENTPPKSISRCRSYPRSSSVSLQKSHLSDHLTVTVARMRRHQLSCQTLGVWTREGDAHSRFNEVKLPRPMETEEELIPYLWSCFDGVYRKDRLIMQTGVVLGKLITAGPRQFSLFDSELKDQTSDALQGALDTIRDRHGRAVIRRGSGF